MDKTKLMRVGMLALAMGITIQRAGEAFESAPTCTSASCLGDYGSIPQGPGPGGTSTTPTGPGGGGSGTLNGPCSQNIDCAQGQTCQQSGNSFSCGNPSNMAISNYPVTLKDGTQVVYTEKYIPDIGENGNGILYITETINGMPVPVTNPHIAGLEAETWGQTLVRLTVGNNTALGQLFYAGYAPAPAGTVLQYSMVVNVGSVGTMLTKGTFAYEAQRILLGSTMKGASATAMADSVMWKLINRYAQNGVTLKLSEEAAQDLLQQLITRAQSMIDFVKNLGLGGVPDTKDPNKAPPAPPALAACQQTGLASCSGSDLSCHWDGFGCGTTSNPFHDASTFTNTTSGVSGSANYFNAPFKNANGDMVTPGNTNIMPTGTYINTQPTPKAPAQNMPPVITDGGANPINGLLSVWIQGQNLTPSMQAQVFYMQSDGSAMSAGAIPVSAYGDGTSANFQLQTTFRGTSLRVTLTDDQTGQNSNAYTIDVPQPAVVNAPAPVEQVVAPPPAPPVDTTPAPTNNGNPLPKPDPAMAPPILNNGGVTTSYEPWAIWFAGQNLTSGMQVQLYDNGNFWKTVPSILSSDGTWGSFSVPSDAMPSGCNRNGQSCVMSVVMTGSNGNSNSFPITMPSAQ